MEGLPWQSSDQDFPFQCPGQRAKILHALWLKNENMKQKQYCNNFDKDFENGPHKSFFKWNKLEKFFLCSVYKDEQLP